ncbi:MAG TPA: hypothetical protein VLB76_26755 [Thermoanaerobaculia bacterium]|jgi:phage-related minor tail protein|nr:hypothetical protein [Thermoanaerobaculia bacterium]
MTTEETLEECRKLGQEHSKEIEDIRSDIEILARALYRAFETFHTKEDAARIEAELAALRQLIDRDN